MPCKGRSFVFPIAYVDDISIVGRGSTQIDTVINMFKGEFQICISDSVDLLFEITIGDSDNKIKLHNNSFIERFLESYGMNKCKPVSGPLPAGLDLTADKTAPLSLAISYWRLVGSLMHLSNTVPPYICFATHRPARFRHMPTNALWKAEKYLMLYLKGIPELGT